MFTTASVLKLLAWPLTLGAAVLVFGISADGTFGMVSEHGKQVSATMKRSPSRAVSMPDVRELTPGAFEVTAPVEWRRAPTSAVPATSPTTSSEVTATPSQEVSRMPGSGSQEVASIKTTADANPTRKKVSVDKTKPDGHVGKLVRLGSTLSVFQSPGGTRLYRLSRGDVVRVLEADGKWLHIVTASGERGWIKAR